MDEDELWQDGWREGGIKQTGGPGGKWIFAGSSNIEHGRELIFT